MPEPETQPVGAAVAAQPNLPRSRLAETHPIGAVAAATPELAGARHVRAAEPHPVAAAVAATPPVRALARQLPGPGRSATVGGAIGSLPLAAVAALAGRLPNRLWIVAASSPRHAAAHMADLETLLGEGAVAEYPQRDGAAGAAGADEPPFDALDPKARGATGFEVSGQRVEAVESLLAGRVRVLVATRRALQEVAPIPGDLAGLRLAVETGAELARDDLTAALDARGFQRAPMVEEVGRYAVRGGIVDLFSFGAAGPARVEFWGDEVESIRLFDILDQRSTDAVERIDVLPVEFRRGADTGSPAAQGVPELDGRSAASLGESAAAADAASAVRCSLLDRLPRDAILVHVGVHEWEEEARAAWGRAEHRWRDERRHGNPATPPGDLFLSPQALRDRLERLPGLVFVEEHVGDHVFTAAAPPPIDRDTSQLREFLAGAASDAADTLILCDNDGQAARLEELVVGRDGRAPPGCRVAVGTLAGGFRLLESVPPFNVLTDHEVFRRSPKLRRTRRFRGAASLEGLAQLSPGDYVVHMEHGIGRYEGIERVEAGGESVEALVIGYDGDEQLRVPVQQLDQVERWVGGDPDAKPRQVHRLGGKRWKTVRQRAENAIHEMTAELLELYAARKSRPGHAFPVDTRWQRELESSFLYEDTPDQREAVKAIKADMESPRAMDRLVCGDVGYGKTEVAVRAAFKAVQDGKQVAVLAPTTVLVAQHARTFGDRMADYPVQVASLSRFESPRRQREVLGGLAAGAVDVAIGTHRLLSADVAFKDLGLLVIDEEQRMGVRQKERLKRLRTTVDVLTLTATPIPRTLYLSLAGIRDLSLIRTPPRNRMPVATHVVSWSDRLVAEACRQELDRGGQVFFLHNRVQTIETAGARVRRLVASATVDVAHGQMAPRELDRAMTRFAEGETDVLVCSSIIENGLDVANANTLIVDGADRFGLSQLYQIRGRVGRSDRRAFCYLIVPDAISDEAEKRLRVLEHYTELGSGYQIAMRDLEVRGAGNLLGEDQSGFAHAVGLDTYLRLLEEAVRRLQKGPKRKQRPRPEVAVDAGAYLPDAYVADERQKLHFYRRLSRMASRREVRELTAEMTDRFGKLPPEARRLLDQSLLGIAGRSAGATRILVRSGQARVNFGDEVVPRVSALEKALKGERVAVEVRRAAPLSIVMECYDPERLVDVVVRAMDALGGRREHDQPETR